MAARVDSASLQGLLRAKAPDLPAPQSKSPAEPGGPPNSLRDNGRSDTDEHAAYRQFVFTHGRDPLAAFPGATRVQRCSDVTVGASLLGCEAPTHT